MTRTSGKRAARLPFSSLPHAAAGFFVFALLQLGAAAQVASAQDLYAKAVEASSLDEETRAEMLFGALRKAEASNLSAKERRELTAQIKAALSEVDPRYEDRLKAQDKAARKALESSLQYAKDGWFRTSEELLNLALRLNPYLDSKKTAEIRGLLPSPNEFLLETFKDATMPYSGDAWTTDESGITSPPPQGRGQNPTTMLLSKRRFVGDYKLQIEVRSSTPTANYGLAFGVTGEGGTYHLLNVINDGKESRLSFEAYKGGDFTNLAVHPIALNSDEWADWVPITLHVNRGQLSAVIGDSAPLIFKTGQSHDGALGLFLAANNDNGKATTFRHLKVSKQD
ncbi:MAG: hypothetical protein ACYTG5_20185 [Planctomycetota bacterium]|jgi:hypothetical protein